MQGMRVKLFADGASIVEMIDVYKRNLVQGFTTNPTLMKKAGVRDYLRFTQEAIEALPDLPISFEVLSDEFPEMERQARKISGWGENVYVKIPITNARGDDATPLVERLSHDAVKINVTAVLTLEQVEACVAAFSGGASGIVSVFAGRIADTGRDPMPIMKKAVQIMRSCPNAEVLWASSRELLNIYQAESCNCHIITVTNDILKKLPLVGMDLRELSLETVRMFLADAAQAGFQL